MRTGPRWCGSTFAAVLVAAPSCAGPHFEQSSATRLSFDRVEVDAGGTTNSILAADIDGDARLDLIVSGSGGVSVLRGRGDGRFGVAASTPAGENPVHLAAADIDADGHLDLIVANHETDYVTLLFGTGDGFEARSNSRLRVDVSPHPHVVRLGDADGDGRADLFVDDRVPESVRLFRGRGDGSFGSSEMIGVGGDPYRGMELADLDGDGYLDLATPNADHVAVLLGDGQGGFDRRVTLNTPFSPFSVAAADWSGDGITDLVAASGEGAGSVMLWSGEDDGRFLEQGRVEIAAGPTKISAADLTGDGRAEILVTSYAGGEVALVEHGDELRVTGLAVDGSPYGATVGDFDGDERLDLAISNDATEIITVFLSRSEDA